MLFDPFQIVSLSKQIATLAVLMKQGNRAVLACDSVEVSNDAVLERLKSACELGELGELDQQLGGASVAAHNPSKERVNLTHEKQRQVLRQDPDKSHLN